MINPMELWLIVRNMVGPALQEAAAQVQGFGVEVAAQDAAAVAGTQKLEAAIASMTAGIDPALIGMVGLGAAAGGVALAVGALAVTAVQANSRLNELASTIKGRGVAAADEFQNKMAAIGLSIDDLTARRFALFQQATDANANAWDRLNDKIALNFLPMSQTLATNLTAIADTLFKVAAAIGDVAEQVSANPWLKALLSGSVGAALLGPAGISLGLLSSLIPKGATSDFMQGAVTRPLNPTDDPAYKAWLASGGAMKENLFSERFALTTGNRGVGQRADPQAALVNLGKLVDIIGKVPVPALKAADSMKMYTMVLDANEAFVKRSSLAVANNFTQMIDGVVSGTQTIGSAFDNLIRGILRSIADAALQEGIGLGLSALGNAIPGGGFLIDVGKHLAGTKGAVGVGPTQVNINALSAKDILRNLISPTGEFRQANMQLAHAGRLP